jgi:drug/metabolite transporter (DMT)-like permease
VRRSGSPVGYAVWLLSLHTLVVMALLWRMRRGRSTPTDPGRGAGWAVAAATCVMSMLAYALVLWAQTHGALAAVAALRESSVVIAAGLGVAVFREPMGWLRIAASAVVATGVVLLAVG